MEGGSELTVTCPACGTDNAIDVGLCGVCGAPVMAATAATRRRRPAEVGAAPPLVVMGGTEIELAVGTRLVLGRDEPGVVGAALTPFDNLSRMHAQLENSAGDLTVTDLGSTNGTFVNGERVTPGQRHPLAPGDELRLARDRVIDLRWNR